jgi:hypothetical protein
VIVDSFRCAAKDLVRYRLQSESMWLRLEGDSDDLGTWQLVRTIRHANFGSIDDPGLQDVKLIAVSFHDETPELALNLTDPELALNLTDPVECAVPRDAHLPGS